MSEDLESLASAASYSHPVQYASPQTSRRRAPSYGAITIGAVIMNIFGGTYVGIGIVIIVLSLVGAGTAGSQNVNGLGVAAAASVGLAGVLTGLAFATVGFIVLMIGSLAIAVRDIARNSWR